MRGEGIRTVAAEGREVVSNQRGSTAVRVAVVSKTRLRHDGLR